jgi:hypothetical protein
MIGDLRSHWSKNGEIFQEGNNADENDDDLDDLLRPSIDGKDIDEIQYQYHDDEGDERANKSVHPEFPSISSQSEPLPISSPTLSCIAAEGCFGIKPASKVFVPRPFGFSVSA